MRTLESTAFLILFCADIALASWKHNVTMIYVFGGAFVLALIYNIISRKD